MKFCDCGKLLDLFDDLEQRKLFYKCGSCNSQIPYEKNLVYTKKGIEVERKWDKYDKSLPLSGSSCFKCQKQVVYQKQSDLTLLYICTNCNERWH